MDLIEIKVLHAAVERRINQEMSVINLTFVQAMVIQYLYHCAGEIVCQKDIQHALGLAHPTVSGILSRLEEHGLISSQTSGKDKRYRMICLTEQGKNLHQDISRIVNHISSELFSGISDAEQADISRVFQKMLANLSV